MPVFTFALLLSRLLATYLERTISAQGTTIFAVSIFNRLYRTLRLSELPVGSQVSNLHYCWHVRSRSHGVQNALIQISFENIPVTAVMTTNVTHFVLALGVLLCGGTYGNISAAHRQIGHLWPVILGFTLGCALGAAAQSAYGSWSIAVPTCFALLALLMVLRSDKDAFTGADRDPRSPRS